jgi:hypothetical protein
LEEFVAEGVLPPIVLEVGPFPASAVAERDFVIGQPAGGHIDLMVFPGLAES